MTTHDTQTHRNTSTVMMQKALDADKRMEQRESNRHLS